MKQFATYLKVEKFPRKKTFGNLSPVIESIQSRGYDLHIKGNYVGIWRNCSRGYRELFFSMEKDPIESAYSCCLKFVEYELRKNEVYTDI